MDDASQSQSCVPTTPAESRTRSPPTRSPGTSGIPGLVSPDLPFRPDAPEPKGYILRDDLSLSDQDNDLFVVTDQPGTDLAQRGLCAAEVRLKSKSLPKKLIQIDPMEVLSRAAPRRSHEVTLTIYI